MKTKNAMITIAIYALSVIPLYAQDFLPHESKGGGGGDASESRVDEIRSDILSWIIKGGAKDLNFPAGTDYRDYSDKMKSLLAAKFVNVTFVERDHETNEELQVTVNGKPKTCRGFFAKLTSTPNIVCNIDRFAKTSPSEQYKLIHHEYAGLAYLKKNEGAASDYFISNQITDYLVPQTVLRLAVKPTKVTVPSEINKDCGFSSSSIRKRDWPEFEQVMIKKGYFRASPKKASIEVGRYGAFSERRIALVFRHKSNYEKKVFGFSKPEKLDPRRAEFRERLEEAKGATAYAAIKREMNETVFYDQPQISALVDFEKDLPTCDEFYGATNLNF